MVVRSLIVHKGVHDFLDISRVHLRWTSLHSEYQRLLAGIGQCLTLTFWYILDI